MFHCSIITTMTILITTIIIKGPSSMQLYMKTIPDINQEKTLFVIMLLILVVAAIQNFRKKAKIEKRAYHAVPISYEDFPYCEIVKPQNNPQLCIKNLDSLRLLENDENSDVETTRRCKKTKSHKQRRKVTELREFWEKSNSRGFHFNKGLGCQIIGSRKKYNPESFPLLDYSRALPRRYDV